LAGRVWHSELTNRRKNGSLYVEEQTITPLKKADDTISHFISIKQDITKRKQVEDALKESEEKYRLIAENTSDGIILFGSDSSVQYISSSYMKQLGYTDMEEFNLTPEMVYSFIHPDERDNIFSKVYEAIGLKKSGLTYSYRAKHKDGHYIWREDNAKFNYDDAGNYSGSHVISRDITGRKQAEGDLHQRVTELEMLYQSGLALSQLLSAKEIGMKILELLEQKLGWYHTRIRLYHPQDDSLELLDFNQPGLKNEMERQETVDHFKNLISRSSQGLSGWVVQHNQPTRSGDVTNDLRYVEAYPGMNSGLYVPMKLGERVVGVISIEDQLPDAFSEADERLIVTLANQAASAFENARLFEETRQRVMELETLNRISLVLRVVSKQDEMLAIVLDEALAILNTPHGLIKLYNKTTNHLEKTVMRGWTAQVTESPHNIHEGISGKVFKSNETYISREFVSDPLTREAARSQIPPHWGGACLPIRTTQQTLGVMIVSVPSERELDQDEIRLLSILSEMTGAALQRMQLHEQTVHRLERLNALRTIDQSISSSLDMRLTLNLLLIHTITQLNLDAADVFLLRPDLNLLELIASRGFHTLMRDSVSLNDSLAGRVITEHRPIMTLDSEEAAFRENLQFGKMWKEESICCYWCLPLIVKGEVKGVLEVYRRSAFRPDAEWLDFLEALAGQAAIAIENTQLFENLQRANTGLSLAYDATIEGWSRAMELRDEETEGHTRRVTDLTVNFAQATGVNNDMELLHIRRGALLHDIGKMGVPDHILLKTEKLTPEEWEIMRRHPQFAYEMLKPIYYLRRSLDIPYCHHEKWDGSGYPRRLKGEEIPLAARIFAVADVYDAVTSDRPYRKAWTKEQALKYIREQSGSHFDPNIVEKFLKFKGASFV
jgi:PAS domain S-box-containing protein